MKNILFLNHQNFLIICQYLLSRIRKEYLKIRWVDLLKTVIQKRLSINNNSTIVEIEKNLSQLNKLIKILHQTLNSQKQIINPKIIEIFNNYNSISSNIINKIFMINILHIDNESGSLLFSNLRDSIPKTYNNYIIKNPPLKPLTLVLDLDETLMSFVYTREKTGQGLLRMRPYLYNFLNSVKEYYELIIFTASTQNYADSILDAIEEFKGQFFSYRLYRNHCSILNNDFVKDISLIGRDLSKTIIVDNMQQNLKFKKKMEFEFLHFGEKMLMIKLFYN
jgi:CTD small phosphatase-like protein 2